jgi:anti-sigma factor RsiW
MSEGRRSLTVEEIHSYADGRLDAARRAEVEALLSEDPDAAARAEAYRRQNEALHAQFDGVLEEPVPAHFDPRLRSARRRTLVQRAAVLAWLVIGPAAGWLAHGLIDRSPAPEFALLPRAAAVAHAVYTPEVIHPVEVAAEQERHLVQWLSKRLDAPLRVPDLNAFAYALVGGRLLPADDGPAAQFMYQTAQGVRLTLYVRAREAGDGDTAFRYAREGGVSVLYWIDGRLGYALSGEVERTELLTMAEAVYRQLGLSG